MTDTYPSSPAVGPSLHQQLAALSVGSSIALPGADLTARPLLLHEALAAATALGVEVQIIHHPAEDGPGVYEVACLGRSGAVRAPTRTPPPPQVPPVPELADSRRSQLLDLLRDYVGTREFARSYAVEDDLRRQGVIKYVFIQQMLSKRMAFGGVTGLKEAIVGIIGEGILAPAKLDGSSAECYTINVDALEGRNNDEEEATDSESA